MPIGVVIIGASNGIEDLSDLLLHYLLIQRAHVANFVKFYREHIQPNFFALLLSRAVIGSKHFVFYYYRGIIAEIVKLPIHALVYVLGGIIRLRRVRGSMPTEK